MNDECDCVVVFFRGVTVFNFSVSVFVGFSRLVILRFRFFSVSVFSKNVGFRFFSVSVF